MYSASSNDVIFRSMTGFERVLLARVNPIIIYTLRQVPSGGIYRYGTNDDREVASHNQLDQVAAHSGNCGMSLLRNGVDALSEHAFPQMLSAGNPQLKLLAKME